MKCIARVFLITGLLATVPAAALGPIDGEVGVFTWLVDDYQDTSVNSPLTGGYGELWLGERWGLRAFASTDEGMTADTAPFKPPCLLPTLDTGRVFR